MNIDVKKHTEEFITKKYVMISEKAKIYYFQFGILKAITDAMAIIDLHADNIMPTEKGPMIIDAEIDFFHYAEHTLLVSGPGNSTQGMKGHNSAFKIKVIKNTKSKDEKAIFLDSFWVFNGNINNNFYLAEYFQEYKEGYNFMISQMKNKKGDFKKMFEEQLKNVNKVRISPVTTTDFAKNLQEVIEDSKRLESVESLLSEKIVDSLIGESVNFLNKNIKIFPNVNDDNRISVSINKVPLKEALLKTLKNGTIPSMYVDMEENIYFYDEIVGHIGCKANPENKINKEKMIEIMTNCLSSMIDKFELLK